MINFSWFGVIPNITIFLPPNWRPTLFRRKMFPQGRLWSSSWNLLSFWNEKRPKTLETNSLIMNFTLETSSRISYCGPFVTDTYGWRKPQRYLCGYLIKARATQVETSYSTGSLIEWLTTRNMSEFVITKKL